MQQEQHTRRSSECGVYHANEIGQKSENDTESIIRVAGRNMEQDSNDAPCPLYSFLWETCAYDQIQDMLDNYMPSAKADPEDGTMELHLNLFAIHWNHKLLKKALQQCGDHPRCDRSETHNLQPSTERST